MAENELGQKKDMVFRVLWNNFLPVIREQGGEIFGRITQAAATPLMGEDKAKVAGKAVDSTFQVGLAVSVNVHDFTKVAKDSRRKIGELLDDVEPYLVEEFGKSSRGKLMRSQNEVIEHARERIMGQTKYGVFKAGSGLIDKVPDLFTLVDRKRAQIDKGLEPDMADGDVRGKLSELGGKAAKLSVFDPENRKFIDMGIRTGAPALQEYIEAEGVERFGGTSAFDMIKEVADQAHSGDGRVDYVYNARAEESQPLAEYIVEIFKQHQQDMGGSPINERFRFMPELEEAAKRIATEIEDNMLDPMALVSLVGNRKVLDDKMRVATPEMLDKQMSEMWRVIERSQDVDSKEFIAETAFATKEDFKEILGGLPESEKPFFASLFPDAVLKEMGGLKQDEIDQLKEASADQFVGQMTQAIETLGTMGEKELQRFGLTAKEGALMRELSDAIDDMGAEAVVSGLQGKAREEVVEAVRNGRGYWQERVRTQQGVEREAAVVENVADEEKEAEKPSFADRLRRGGSEERAR